MNGEATSCTTTPLLPLILMLNKDIPQLVLFGESLKLCTRSCPQGTDPPRKAGSKAIRQNAMRKNIVHVKDLALLEHNGTNKP